MYAQCRILLFSQIEFELKTSSIHSESIRSRFYNSGLTFGLGLKPSPNRKTRITVHWSHWSNRWLLDPPISASLNRIQRFYRLSSVITNTGIFINSSFQNFFSVRRNLYHFNDSSTDTHTLSSRRTAIAYYPRIIVKRLSTVQRRTEEPNVRLLNWQRVNPRSVNVLRSIHLYEPHSITNN